jgi:hypothetical protein
MMIIKVVKTIARIISVTTVINTLLPREPVGFSSEGFTSSKGINDARSLFSNCLVRIDHQNSQTANVKPMNAQIIQN